MIRIKLRSLLVAVLLALPIIPLYNRLLTHVRPDRYSFNFQTLFLEYLLVILLLLFMIFVVNSYRKNIYGKHIKVLTTYAVLICVTTFVSTLFSLDFSRSIQLFLFALLGPLFLFFLIAYYLPANEKNLEAMLKGFLLSTFIYLLLSYFMSIRTLSFADGLDLLEFRSGGNIYGSNSVIGSISFLIPLIFISNNFSIAEYNSRNLLIKVFALLSIIWIILSVSRWGYAVLVFSYLLTTIVINKKINYRVLFGIATAFLIVSIYIVNISDILLSRFSGGQEFIFENIIETTTEEARFARWENAFIHIKNNPLLGVGLGNNYMIDIRQSAEAHNLLINFTVERGIVNLVILIGLVFKAFELNKSLQRSSSNIVLRRHSQTITIGLGIFFFWSLTAGSFVQPGGIISAVKAYYFMVAIALIVLICRVDSEKHYE